MTQLKDFCSDLSKLQSAAEFKEGQILLVDKPMEWTSFDVVKKIRAKLQHGLKMKKIKVGHAGTLDPLATGLVIVCIGKATKEIQSLMDQTKTYEARIKFGFTTPSFDLETESDGTFPTDHIDEDLIQQALEQFPREQMQIPPQYSAIKIKGKRAYDLARGGQDFEINARPVVFHALELLRFQDQEATVRIVCSKGTYIRSFARDLGLAVDSGACLSGLKRTAIGSYSNDKALSIKDIENQVEVLKEKFSAF